MSNTSILSEQQVERIDRILDELQQKTRAVYVLLADISGQLIRVRGRTGAIDCVALAALMASNMAATAEMARRIGEKKGFRLLFHEGEQENIYLSHAGQSFLLGVIFDTSVQIGLVRLFSKRAVEELNTFVDEYEAVVGNLPSALEAGFDTALDDALDQALPHSSSSPWGA